MMKSPSPQWHCELQLPLHSECSDLVRAFVREAALAETVPAPFAGLIANDSAKVWLALCTLAQDAPDGERAHIKVKLSRQDVTAAILLSGHSRFSNLVASVSDGWPPEAGIACRQTATDGWEISLHRSVTGVTGDALAVAELPPEPAPAPALAHDIDIALPVKSDAPSIARCFREVYGHHYVHAEVFSPRRYWTKVESGEVIPVVARGGSDEVIGHVALERGPRALVAERGEAVVLPEYRGHHLLERMTERLSTEAPKRGLHGIYAEPLTIHTFSQRNDERAGMPVCAVLLGANPESFRPKDMSCPTAGQRQSYLRTFRFVQQPAARAICVPAPYSDILLRIYESLGVAVTLSPESGVTFAASRTGIKVNDRGYGAIQFEQIGPNFAIELSQALRDVRAIGARSVQLSAPVADPGLPLLTDAARELGFFFCGLAPAFADGADLLLLQLLSEPLDTAKLQLFTDQAKELVAFIDRERSELGVRKSSPSD